MAPALLKNLDIRTRLLLLCLGVATPLLLTCSFVIWKEYQALSQIAKRATAYHDQVALRTLDHFVSIKQDRLHALTVLPPFQTVNLEGIKQLLESQRQAQKNCNALALYDATGKLLVAAAEGNAAGSGKLPDLLLGKMQQQKSYVSGYTPCPITNAPAVLFAQPLITSGQMAGCLVESIKPQAIAQVFAGLDEPDDFVVIVVDTNKRCIARSIDNALWQGKDFSQARTVTAANQSGRGTIEGVGIVDPTQRTYAFDRMANTGWLVTVGIPTQSIYGSAEDRLIDLVACMLVMVALSLGLAYAFTRNFTVPIHELVKEAVAIGRGDLSKRVQTMQGGELGLLARAFNQMALNLEMNREHKAMIERISESVRQSLDMNEILNTTVFELGRALNASRCCLAVVESAQQDIAGKHLEFNYVWFNDKLGGTSLKNRSVMITEGSILKIILEQGAILSLDVMDDSTFTPLFEQAEESPEDWKSIKSLIACPIVLNKQPIGMILVHQCDRRRVWFELELELVEAVARHVALALDHGHLFARAREMAEQQFLINQIVRSTRSSLDHDTILDTVTRELGKALEVDYCQIAQPRESGPLVITHEYQKDGLPAHKGLSLYGKRLDFHPEFEDAQELRSVLGIDLAELRQESGGFEVQEVPISVIQNVSDDRRVAKFSEFIDAIGSKSLMAAPLLRDDRVLGILILHQCKQARVWQPNEVRLTAAIADQLAVAISHAQLFEHVQHQAITDGLTSLYNHIYFKNRLAEEINRAQRKSTSCSLLMLDLDKLKQINDTFGHPIGDAAIRQVSVVLKSVLRSGDTAARYGGEEFGVILPETPLSEAALIAERLRASINKTPVPGLGHISTSIGVASFPQQASTVAELIDRADRALYIAKRAGRNRVCIWDDLAPHSVSEQTATPDAPAAELPGGKAPSPHTAPAEEPTAG